MIERARAFPDGIAAFLAAHGIEEKLYYRRFRKLRKTHPEWKNLTRRGRKGGAKKKSGEPCRSPKASVQAGAVPRNEQNFAPVQLVDPCRNLTVNDQSSVEIILPNSLVLRIPAGCPTEYLASIVLAMRGL